MTYHGSPSFEVHGCSNAHHDDEPIPSAREENLRAELDELKHRLMKCEKALYEVDDSGEYFDEYDPEHLQPEELRGVYGAKLRELREKYLPQTLYIECSEFYVRHRISHLIAAEEQRKKAEQYQRQMQHVFRSNLRAASSITAPTNWGHITIGKWEATDVDWAAAGFLTDVEPKKDP